MRFLVVFFLFICSNVFSQKTIKVKNEIRIEFENFQDTVFRGYQNLIYIKGIKNLEGIVVFSKDATITLSDKNKNCFIVIPGAGKTIELLVTRDKKEIYKKNIVVSVLGGRQLEILKMKAQNN